MLLTPGTLSQIVNPDRDRLVLEFKTAAKLKRNIVLITTRDFQLSKEIQAVGGVLENLTRFPVVRTQIKRVPHTAEQLKANYLSKSAAGSLEPTPQTDQSAVETKREQAVDYAQQATIRLNSEKQFFEAVATFRRGEHEQALRMLDLIIADNPNNENAYLQRAMVLRELGRRTAALRDYEQAARLSPKLLKAHVGQGELLLEMERYLLAKQAYETALRIKADAGIAIIGMSLTEYALGDMEASLRHWQRLKEHDSRYADSAWIQQSFDWGEKLMSRLEDVAGAHN